MLKHEIYQITRNAIDLGHLMPGERLTEIRLSEEFGCSRGPVREALNRLEREGFVTLVPNQGAIVNKYFPDEIEDFYSLLELLEGKAVEWATPILISEDIDKLSEINNSMKKLSRDEKEYVENWNSKNMSFHRLIREKCGNQKMNWLVEEILLRITRYRYMFLLARNFDEYSKDHDVIIESIKRSDPRLARENMVEHIHRAKNLLMDFFYQMPEYSKAMSMVGKGHL